MAGSQPAPLLGATIKEVYNVASALYFLAVLAGCMAFGGTCFAFSGNVPDVSPVSLISVCVTLLAVMLVYPYTAQYLRTRHYRALRSQGLCVGCGCKPPVYYALMCATCDPELV